ncbi:MAG: glycosyltransferase family 2 protein [Planctomycetaceae bacterium]
MKSQPKVSVVLPVRDAQNRIADEVRRILEALTDLSRDRCELIVVDDGSQDATLEALDELVALYPQVRIARHTRPRGIEAAGQTGLEKATGEIVFIQEGNRAVRVEDMRRLFKMAEDETIVAARTESKARPIGGALLRRLRAWGAAATESLDAQNQAGEPTSLQMIRRPHLQRLSGPHALNLALQSESFTTTSML